MWLQQAYRDALQFSHLHVDFLRASLVLRFQLLECLFALFRRLLVVAQCHGELVPQILNDGFQLNAQRMLVFQILTDIQNKTVDGRNDIYFAVIIKLCT